MNRHYKQAARLLHTRTANLSTVSDSILSHSIECGPLTAVRVMPNKYSISTTTRPPIIMIPGMHHDAWYFRGLQNYLATRGYASYALTLRPFSFFKASLSMDGGRLKDIREAILHLQTQIRNPIILGHSQGGLLMQMYLDIIDSSMPDDLKCRGAILYATGALGQQKPFLDLLRQLTKTLSMTEIAGIGYRGYNAGMKEMQRLFFLPSTLSTTVTGEEISLEKYWEYTSKSSVSRMGEGMTTYCHPLCTRWAIYNPQPLLIPSLAVLPEHDILYRRIHHDWFVNYHKSKLLIVPGQAHCLGDEGWENNCARPLADWLDTFK